MTNQAFATFVYGGYHKFLPFYTYCINKTYPEAAIVVFYLGGSLPANVKAILENNSTVFLYDDFTMEDAWLEQYKHRGAVKQSLRHLLPVSFFEAYDEVYMGDVDILMLKEHESLFKFHKKQAEKHRLPFSNKVRVLPDGTPSKRLTGLQYIITKLYYDKMQPVIDLVMQDQTARDEIFSKSERNEEVLYYLCEKAFQYDLTTLVANERPWHGFHLGLIRGKDFLNEQTVAENSSIPFSEIKAQLSAMMEDPTFVKMVDNFFCPELFHALQFMQIDVPKHVKERYQKKIRQQNVKKWKRRLRKKLRF